jgi:hypothetical protein
MNACILDCEKCGQVKTIPDSGFSCDECENSILLTPSFDFFKCPVCEGTQFYKRKDFNSAFGCLVILVGAMLVPYTFGLSLLAVAIIDWMLYKKVPDSGVCYACKAEFKGFKLLPDSIKSFDHHTAELYEEP